MSTSVHSLTSSYRDPSGFMFSKDGQLYRQVNKSFKEDYDHFISSGCYASLTKQGLLIPHQQLQDNSTSDPEGYIILQPEVIPFISYPWEWSFDMLKDAALLTLQLVKESLKFGMILKDATPFNIQWLNGKPVFIDTLSFEKYNCTEPWIAYRQYCECFLGPLLIMHYTKQSLHQLLLAFPEGIPLPVTKSLLPWRSRFSLHVWLHIHMHANVASGKKPGSNNERKFSEKKLNDLLTSLEIVTQNVNTGNKQTTWSGYYEEAGQRADYLEKKKQIIQEWLSQTGNLKTAVDLGANDGLFSEMLAANGIFTVAADFDPVAVNNLYKDIKKKKLPGLQPLLIDLANPSPNVGFANKERASFSERINVDIALALALIHHLAIGKNIPFELIAEYFSGLTKLLIIEFVPKEDPMIIEMLKGKKDIYIKYTKADFETSFLKHFSFLKTSAVGSSGRILYFMQKCD